MIVYAGVESKECVFILNDSSMKNSFILEDVNSLLNSGNIPNLFSQEDFIPHIDNLRALAKKQGRNELWQGAINII